MGQLKRFIVFVSVAILASFWLFIAMMTYLTVVSPSLVFVGEVTIYIASLSILVVLTSSVVFLGFRNFAVSEKDADIESFRRRSGRCRRLSFAMLGVMVMVAFMGLGAAIVSVGEDGGISRFASFVLLVIFMRILASVYRYNLRLASFYDARADYLCLAGNEKDLSHNKLLELVGTDDLSTTFIRKFLCFLMGRSSFRDGRN